MLAFLSWTSLPQHHPSKKEWIVLLYCRGTREVRLDVSMLRHAMHPLWPIFDLTSPLVGLDHDTRAFVQWRIEGRGTGSQAPFIFRPNWGPKGWNNFFWTSPPPPYLRVWMTGFPTDVPHSFCTMSLVLLCPLPTGLLGWRIQGQGLTLPPNNTIIIMSWE